jgi:hypothetical protein
VLRNTVKTAGTDMTLRFLFLWVVARYRLVIKNIGGVFKGQVLKEERKEESWTDTLSRNVEMLRATYQSSEYLNYIGAEV